MGSNWLRGRGGGGGGGLSDVGGRGGEKFGALIQTNAKAKM